MTIGNKILVGIVFSVVLISLNVSTSLNAQVEDAPQVDMVGDGTLRRIRVPILMYHYVGVLPPDADAIRVGLTVEPDLFRAQMQYLVDNGYTTISLYEMDEALLNGSPLPERPVVLTFDDGHIDHYTSVFPVLEEFGMTGTFFVITDFADNGAADYMNWQQINEMAQAGMDIEPHTRSHRSLRERDNDFLVFEIVGSIESIIGNVGTNPRMFAYPAGQYDEGTIALLETTPIQRAVTTQSGTFQTTDNRLELPRMRVTNDTSPIGLNYLMTFE